MIEVLKQALETLEELNETQSYWWQEVDEATLAKINSTITSLRQAIAELEKQLCKYGNEPALCTSSPMDCQCAIDAALGIKE